MTTIEAMERRQGVWLAGHLLARLAYWTQEAHLAEYPETQGRRLGWIWSLAHRAAEEGVDVSDVRDVICAAWRGACRVVP